MTGIRAEAVKDEALRLGFKLVGITTPEPPPHWKVFEHWLSKGQQGEMNYLASERSRERRADPRKILPDCQSILVLGMTYPFPEHHTASLDREGFLGSVAAYACGKDYHDLIPPRLEALVAYIEKMAGKPVSHKFYTDTGPVLERDLAQRAGLGWIGKNTCLIHPSYGSYFFIAEIFLGLELEPDHPFLPDRCGTCTRCIEACPTGCILPERTLDARRCISYLTIELKGAIPLNLRPALGDCLFGCDICQQVCPWNQHTRNILQASATSLFTRDLNILPMEEFHHPRLLEEVSLTPDTFNRKFRGTPVMRAKRRGYLRNVTVGLGNLRSDRSIPFLAKVLKDEAEPLVRSHAAWALGRIRNKTAFQALTDALDNEDDEDVCQEIQMALNSQDG